jgi:hypothetical protein
VRRCKYFKSGCSPIINRAFLPLKVDQ